jgi:Dolichol-phosphate mannosyltransferase subunit 3 (DPM3)
MIRPLHRFLGIFLSVALAWFATFQGYFDQQIKQHLGPVVFGTVRGQVTLFPLYAVVALGFYGIFSIAYALATFRDCPEKATELQEVSGWLLVDASSADPC